MTLLKIYTSMSEKTWAFPILLAILSLIGLLGALVFDGFIDHVYVLLLAISAFAFFIPWLKPNDTKIEEK